MNSYLEGMIEIVHNYDLDQRNKHSIMRKLFSDFKSETAPYYKDLYIKASSGAGNFAEVPWIIFTKPEITTGASKGYYVVILFDSIRKGIVIQLCYAWTPFKTKYGTKRGLAITEQVSASVRKELDSQFNTSNFDKTIKAIGTGILSRGYLAGSIIGKYIPLEEIDNNDVVRTMNELLNYYDFMSENLIGALDFDDVIKNVEKEKSIIKGIQKTEEEYMSNLDFASMQMHNGYETTAAASRAARVNTPIARDSYKKTRESQSKVGDQGETIVMLKENYDLKETKYKSKILTTDGDGYDVLSFEKSGAEKYIEVKSTSSRQSKITFFISQNELDRARELDNYYLYIVIGVGSKNPEIFQFKQPFGKNKKSDYSEFKLEATKYKVTINLKN